MKWSGCVEKINPTIQARKIPIKIPKSQKGQHFTDTEYLFTKPFQILGDLNSKTTTYSGVTESSGNRVSFLKGAFEALQAHLPPDSISRPPPFSILQPVLLFKVVLRSPQTWWMQSLVLIHAFWAPFPQSSKHFQVRPYSAPSLKKDPMGKMRQRELKYLIQRLDPISLNWARIFSRVSTKWSTA